MNVYNRKLFFNRGGQVSARGTGITSGLVPVKMHAGGAVGHLHRDEISGTGSLLNDNVRTPEEIDAIQRPSASNINFQSNFDKNLALLKGVQTEKKPFDRFGANVEPLMAMFGEWMSGTSYQSGL